MAPKKCPREREEVEQAESFPMEAPLQLRPHYQHQLELELATATAGEFHSAHNASLHSATCKQKYLPNPVATPATNFHLHDATVATFGAPLHCLTFAMVGAYVLIYVQLRCDLHQSAHSACK